MKQAKDRTTQRTAKTAAAQISMSELQRLMRDPDVPDASLQQYFTVNSDASRPFSPGIIPNPERVAVASPTDAIEGAMLGNWANDLARLRRQAKFNRRRDKGDRAPVLVSEGDSWFQFPVFLDDVVDNLYSDFNIWSVDAAGDTLQNMVLDDAEYMRALREHEGTVRAFLFSGGGNDVIGEDATGQAVVSKIVRPYKANQSVDWYIDTRAFVETLGFIENCYRDMLNNVGKAFPGLPVICHGYDYAIPGGSPGDHRNPLWAQQDKWIGRAMREDLGIKDAKLQRDIVRAMVDRLNERISALCGGNNASGVFRNAWHVDVRGVVNGISEWADELHPTNSGFIAVTDKIRTVIRRALNETVELASHEQMACHHGDDADVDIGERAESWEAPATEASIRWRTAKSLEELRRQINARFPGRRRNEDGTIGDAAHASRSSDHNPWVIADGIGVVTAMDITHDPAVGCTGDWLSEALRASHDTRIKYIIWNRRICSSTKIGATPAWQWRPYDGKNPHSKHLHLSVKAARAEFDATRAWSLGAETQEISSGSPEAGRHLTLVSVSKPESADFELAFAEAEAPRRQVTVGNSGQPGPASKSQRQLVAKGKSILASQPRPHFNIETVFSPDERVRILDTELAPWRMICALRIAGQGGEKFIGTGWFAGPRTIITAGHCVHHRKYLSGWATAIEISPGRDGNERPYGTLRSNRLSSVDRWVESEDPDFDIGCIHLTSAPDLTLGWFAIGALPPDELEGYLVNVAGYPKDLAQGTQLYHHKKQVVSVSDRRVFYDVDTYGGQSGAPVWIHETEDAPPLVIGIHAYGEGGSPDALRANSAPRMIPEVLDQIRTWVEADGGWPQAKT